CNLEDRFMTATRLAIVALACAVAAPASAQLLQRKDLSYPIALTIAQAALDDCKARGYATSVVVVDRGGNTVVAPRAANTHYHTAPKATRARHVLPRHDPQDDHGGLHQGPGDAPRAARADHATERDRHRRRRAAQGRQRRDRRGRTLRLARRRRTVRDGRGQQGEGPAAVGLAAIHDEARNIRDREHLCAGEAARHARPQEGASDRREHAAGRSANPDPGASRWRALRARGRAASLGSMQATR